MLKVRQTSFGIASLLVSNIGWGVLPLYWHAMSSMDSMNVLAYRLVTTLITLVAFLLITRRLGNCWQSYAELWRDRRAFLLELGATACITINWLLYIYLVVNGQALQTSIAYYLMPLLNVLFAALLFHERLGRGGWLALVCVATGLGMFIAQSSSTPWLAVLLAVSFCLYGLLKRYVPLDAVQATTFETAVVVLFAMLWLLFQPRLGLAAHMNVGLWALIICAGLATGIPLVTFAYGVQHAQYLTVSFIQYLNPTLQFAIAEFVFHEPMRPMGYAAFVVIWLALIIYSVDQLKRFIERLKTK